MTTIHRLLVSDSRNMEEVPEESIHLVVTSPPYPLVAMWDGVFSKLSADVNDSLTRGDGRAAFEAAHRELDRVWRECYRVLRPGGIACVNIGDATRTLGNEFRMYSNHTRILGAAEAIGFTTLPDILWRKPTNAPNKFMGSGMLPGGAYVTYEHEYILIFRKGNRRKYPPDEGKVRRESAYFWEERNAWFSDVWQDLKGVSQVSANGSGRLRSAAFPFELAYRLINMYSIHHDTVLDPFMGTGTVSVAAIASGRNSVGLELDRSFESVIHSNILGSLGTCRDRVLTRISDHERFVRHRLEAGHRMKHINLPYGFPVVTSQERELCHFIPEVICQEQPNVFKARYRRLDRSNVNHPSFDHANDETAVARRR